MYRVFLFYINIISEKMTKREEMKEIFIDFLHALTP